MTWMYANMNGNRNSYKYETFTNIVFIAQYD